MLDRYGFRGVALHSANMLLVFGDCKPLLIAAGGDLTDQRQIEFLAGGLGRGDQCVDLGPALAVQGKTDGLGCMPQYVAKELADVSMLVAHVVV